MNERVLMMLDLVRGVSPPEVDRINSEILIASDMHAHASGMFKPDAIPQHLYTEAQEFLKSHRHKSALLPLSGASGLKSLPFWQYVLTTLDLRAEYVMLLRHPLQGSEADVSQWLIMWASLWVQTIEKTHGTKRIIVSQELLQNGLAAQLCRVNDFLQLSNDESAELNRSLAANVTGIARQRVELGVLNTVPYGMELYDCLCKVAKEDLQFESVEFAARWTAIMQEFVANQPMYEFIDTLLAEQGMLDFKLYYIRQSWLWKILSPLRALDDSLRQRRRQSKLQNRVITSHA